MRYPSARVTAPASSPEGFPTPLLPESTPKRDLRALLPDELTAWVKAAGAPAYRAEQIFRWLHGQGVASLEGMANVPAALRTALEREYQVTPLAQEVVQTAHDGTRKLRFRTHDGRTIESVLIPDEDAARNKLTLCMLTRRTFQVVLVRPGKPVPFSFTPKPDKTIVYAGDATTVKL